MGSIREMLNPRSVALIGASDAKGSVGLVLLNNLLGSGSHTLFPVNPNRQSVLGQTCFPHIADVPQHVDLAVIATPAATVPAVVRECGEAQAGAAVIISSGFADSGPEGRRREKELGELIRNYRTRVIGPNSMGLVVPRIGLNATFLRASPPVGNIAFISQSGAVGDALVDWAAHEGIGCSLVTSFGSMIDVGFGEVIDFLGQDFNTRSIILFMENVGNAKRFISAARACARTKPIIVLKPGRSLQSSEVLAAATGQAIGDDLVYDAAFKRTGIVRVREVGELFNVAQVLDSQHLPNGPAMAIVTNAAGVGLAALDTLAEVGGKSAKLSAPSIERLKALCSPTWNENNLIEMSADANETLYMDVIDACLHDEGVNGVLVVYTPRASADPVGLARRLIDVSKKTAKSIIAVWMGGALAAEGRHTLLLGNVPAHAAPEEAVRTYMYMYHYRRNIELLYETPVDVHAEPTLRNHLKALLGRRLNEQKHHLGTAEALSVIRNYGLKPAQMAVATDVGEVGAAAKSFGLPVTITVRSAEGDHCLPLVATSNDLDDTLWKLERHREEGVEIIVAKERPPADMELTLESKRDPDFGAIIILSAAEGNAIALPPLNQVLAQRLIEEAGINSDCQGANDRQELVRQVEKLLICFSNIVVDFPEVERVRVALSAGAEGSVATDAVVALDTNYVPSSPYPHLVVAPYPSRYNATWRLRDGTHIVLRPIKPEDEPMTTEMLATVSEETLRVRFFSVLEITHDFLMRFCDIDYDREICIIAEAGNGNKKRMIGGVRLITEPDTLRAEFALLVHDRYQGLGLGSKLVDTVIGIAQEKGLEEIYGTVLTDNHKMLTLARQLGFRTKTLRDGITIISLPLRT